MRGLWILPLTAGFLLWELPFAIAQHDRSSALQSPTIAKAKRPSGRDDIELIGTRRIAGSKLGDWYSPEREAEMGRKYARAVEENAEVIHDPLLTDYVNRLGQNLVRNSDAQVPFTIKVIASDELNAFALPGGFLYVNSGLILSVQNEAELAGVMAHEIAHVAARHATRQMTRKHIFDLASIPVVFLSGGVGIVVQEALNVGTPLGVTKFSRSFETEADYLAVQYMYKAGYDPQALVAFFERVQKLQRHNPGGVIARAFSTHPQTASRIKKTQNEIAKILPPRSVYVVSTSDFDEMQSRLYAMEYGPRAIQNSGGPPGLHRNSSGPDSDSRISN
jgi:beta-barrel assembly-enhancing protease